MSYPARGPALAGIDGRGALERSRGDVTVQARREPAHQPRANRPLPGRTFAKSAKALLHLPRANAISRRLGHPRMKASLVEASA
jgi:hypothetical protein